LVISRVFHAPQGRIGEDHVDAFVGQLGHFGHAIALQDSVQRQQRQSRARIGLPYRSQRAHANPPFFISTRDL